MRPYERAGAYPILAVTMIVNLYVDHLMAPPPVSADEVWNATRVHAKLYNDAAKRIGLSAKEYDEFRGALLDGKAVYVKLPRRVDEMAGARRGHVYAIRNAVMTSSVMGWRVSLADGAIVYVPQICGNLSLLRPAVVAKLPAKHVPKHATFHPAIAHVPKEQVVTFAPPAGEVPVQVPVVPQAAPAVAVAVPAAGHGGSAFFFLIPALIGGVIGGSHSSPTKAPPCSNGSNSLGICSTK